MDRLRLATRTGFGTYALSTPTPEMSSTNGPDPYDLVRDRRPGQAHADPQSSSRTVTSMNLWNQDRQSLLCTMSLQGDPRRRAPGSRPGGPRCDREAEGQGTGQH